MKNIFSLKKMVLIINKCEFLSTATNNWKEMRIVAFEIFLTLQTKNSIFWSHQSLFKVENTYDIFKNN